MLKLSISLESVNRQLSCHFNYAHQVYRPAL